MSLSSASVSARSARLGALGIALALIAAELPVVSLLYQHEFVFTCRDAAPAWFCAFAGRIVPRALGVLAGLTLFALARRHAVSALLETPGPRRAGLMLNAAGFALALAPWLLRLNDDSSAAMVAGAAVAWTVGGLLTAAGLALTIAPPRAWRALLARHGATLGALLAVGLALPELADELQPLWRIEAVAAATFSAVVGALSWLGYVVQAIPDTKVIGADGFFVAVGPQCSGVEGFMLISVFLALHMALFRRELRFPHVLALFPIGLGLSFLFNILRITLILVIGLEGRGELAVGAFHSHAGWLAFTALSILLILASRGVPAFARAAARGDGGDGVAPPAFFSDPAVGRILPFIAFMGTALLASTLSATPSLLYPWRALAMGGVLALFWPMLRALPWRIDPLAAAAGGAVAAMWIATAPAGGAPAPYGALAGGALAVWIAARIVGAALFVPIIEELFFRDYLMSRIAPSGKPWPMIAAVAITTTLFALLHDRWIAAAIAGLVFAGLVWRSRNVADAILAHGVANGLIAIFAAVTGAWHIL